MYSRRLTSVGRQKQSRLLDVHAGRHQSVLDGHCSGEASLAVALPLRPSSAASVPCREHLRGSHRCGSLATCISLTPPQPSGSHATLTVARRAYSHTEGESLPPPSDSADPSVPYSSELIIGDVAMPVPDYVRHPQRVPWVVPGTYDSLDGLLRRVAGQSVAREENLFFSVSDPLTRYYLRWLCQKELLGQDMCLLGDPGPALRWLVLLYAHLTRREVCVVSLNRDITESDLKQRREIRNGSLVYEDQSAVTAAKEGHLLVLEGLERVERNVLPVINNLLENREMHLDNGSVLIHPARYDALLRDAVQARLALAARTGSVLSHGAASEDAYTASVVAEAQADLTNMGLLRVSEKFRVVGITVPVPPYEGSPLDPPLRSRFQCLYVRTGLPAMPTSKAPFLAAADKPARERAVGKLQEQRLGALVKLHAAIEAINATTGAFANSRPSRPHAKGQDRGRGGSGRLSQTRKGQILPGEEADLDMDAEADASATATPLQPVRNVGNFEMGVVARQLHLYPDLPVGEALVRGFPWPLYAEAQTRATTGSGANTQEAQRIANHYRTILSQCGIGSPLLLQSTAAAASPPPSPSSPSIASARSAFRALVGSGAGNGEAEVRAFIANTGLLNSVHHGDENAKSVAVPKSVSEAANYIVRLEAPRLCPCEGAELAEQTVCVVDAVIATATQATTTATGKPASGGEGTYTIPVTIGRYAGLRLLDQRSRASEGSAHAASVVDIAARCAGSNMVLTTELYHAMQTMLQLHASRQHMLLVGDAGSGKTALIREFAHLLGYEVETMHLYADMTNKDLFQRRTTDAKTGNTTWDNAALIDAAIHGRLVVLDGIDKLPPGMLTSLQQLLVDQSVNLFDGTSLKPQDEYALLKETLAVRDRNTGEVLHRLTDGEMREKKIFPIHPAFRVIATARPPSSASGGGGAASGASASAGSRGGGAVFNHDMTTLFGVVTMPEARRATLEPVLHQVAMREVEVMVSEGVLPASAQLTRRETARHSVTQLLRLREEVAVLRQSDAKIMPLTFRQLLHLVRGAVRFPEQLALSVSSALLVSLMTGVTLTQVTDALARCGLSLRLDATVPKPGSPPRAPAVMYESLVLQQAPQTQSGSAVSSAPVAQRTYTVNGSPVLVLNRLYTPRELALVPFVTGFHANPMHDTIIAWLAKQYGMGSNILLIGNQGVGKNKVVDAFLSHVRIPRHYLQLHRDTTVGSLTINPTVEGGKVRWEDSPLVKAVQQGHCLVVDEIDKAPVEVVQVLKGLIEDREMRLGDGRRIVSPELYTKIQATGADTTSLLAIHPGFRIIVLANPPGFPFHGNDFFRECGDLFSSYVMANPDRASQLQVLEAYAPGLPQPLMVSLIEAFRQLQDGFSQGNLSYPFSLRELIAVVKHLSRFPQDGIYEALNNVFNFDARDENTLRYVRQVLHHYLSAHTAHGASARLLPLRAGQPHKLTPLPEPITVPYARAHTGSDGGATTSEASLMSANALGTFIHLQPDELRAVVKDLAADCPPLLFWRQRFTESDFYDRQASAAMASSGFTEWTDVRTMPFVDAQSDTVLGVTSTGQYSADANEAVGSFVSFLLLRRRQPHAQHVHRGDVDEEGSAADGKNDKGAASYVVATVRLPPASLDPSSQLRTHVTGTGAGAMSLLAWPVGEVHFMDVTLAVQHLGVPTRLSSASDDAAAPASLPPFALRLEDFNATALADVWSRPSEAVLDTAGLVRLRRLNALDQLGMKGGSGGDAFAEGGSPPTLLLSGAGKALLIDVLASPSTVAPLAIQATRAGAFKSANEQTNASESVPPSSSSSASAAARFELRGALLPLSLNEVAAAEHTRSGDSGSDAKLWQCGAFSPTGLLWQVAPTSAMASNTLRILSAGYVVSVMTPLPLERVRFISPHVAAVTLRTVSSAAPERIHGAMRVVVDPALGEAHASFVPLPRSVADTMEVVDVVPVSAPVLADTPTDASASHAGKLLRGLVLVPRALDDTSSPASTSSSAEAAYMLVEGATSDHVTLRLFPSDARTSRPAEPLYVDSQHHQLVRPGGVVVDVAAGTARQLAAAPMLSTQSASTSRPHNGDRGEGDSPLWSVNTSHNAATAYAPSSRQLAVADLDVERVQRRYADWSAMLTGNAGQLGDGADPDSEKRVKPFNMEYSTPRKQPSGTLKHGEVDDKEHHGGNTWAGGTGGTDTAGLGGLIGPYRLDKGNTVHQVSPEEKRKVPKHLVEEARRMGKEALRERLAAIGMSEEEYARYNQLQERVRPSINQLRTLLMGLKAAEGERTWLKGQSDGVWDDKKLVEGIVGEKNVYKRRVDSKDTNPFVQKHKKRVVFVLDVSASMYRFEGMDHRLTRLMESTIMVMESFAGFDAKIDYCLMGHNGDDEAIELVPFGQPPANQRERMEVCMKMIAYAQYCWSGDNTVEAMRHSLNLVTKEKGDSYFVFVISDANLRQYGIMPQELSEIILSRKPEVQMFCIFIATLGAQSSQLQRQLPAGHGYECMQTDELPHILRKIFSSVNLL